MFTKLKKKIARYNISRLNYTSDQHHIIWLKSVACWANSTIIASSKNLLMLTSSLIPCIKKTQKRHYVDIEYKYHYALCSHIFQKLVKKWVCHTFRRLVFTINSRARCWIGAGSSGRKTMLLSRGSPGTIAQWSNTERQNACPCVWYLKSVSKPNDSITGKNAYAIVKPKTRWAKSGRPLCTQLLSENSNRLLPNNA